MSDLVGGSAVSVETTEKGSAAQKLKKIGNAILKSGVISWLLLLLIWQVASMFNKPEFLPSPWKTLQGLGEIFESGVLMQDIGISLQRVAIGWGRGILIAVPLGLLIGNFKAFRSLVEPLINFFRFVPAIGFLTLFLMWFGVGEASKTVLITYASIFPIIINTVAAVGAINPTRYQAAESLGASRWQRFLHVTVPGAVPGIFTGVRLGLSAAIISIVGAEMLAADSGLGYLVYTSRLYYRTDWIFVGIVILGLLGFLADRLLRLLAKVLLKHYGVTG
ncbi:MAG: ABC transporter permease [Eubacterium sp.]|nr:ABC transporter permease [Eubacterium sp.]